MTTISTQQHHAAPDATPTSGRAGMLRRAIVAATAPMPAASAAHAPTRLGALRIGIVDNDPCALSTLTIIVDRLNRPGLRIRRWATTSPSHAVEQCCTGDATDAMLIDMTMNGITGDQVARRIRAASPRTVLIGITEYDPIAYREDAYRAGMHTVLDKAALWSALPPLIDGIACGTILRTMAVPHDAQPCPALTATEYRITVLSAAGLTAKQIAATLNIAASTVFSHRRNIKNKLHAPHWQAALAQCRDMHII